MENQTKIPTKEKVVPVKSAENGEYNIEIVRDFSGEVDIFYLSKKDPNFEYRFLRDEQKNLSIKTGNLLHQKGGWKICPKEHLLRLGIKEGELSADNLLRRGDTILAFIPKKLYDEKAVRKSEEAQKPMRQLKRMLKDGDASTGGEDMHKSMKGIQTKKDLGL